MYMYVYIFIYITLENGEVYCILFNQAIVFYYYISVDSPVADGSDLCGLRVCGVHVKSQIPTTLKIWSHLR